LTCAPILREGPGRSGEYDKWRVERAFLLVPAQAFVGHTCKPSSSIRRARNGSFVAQRVLAKTAGGWRRAGIDARVDEMPNSA